MGSQIDSAASSGSKPDMDSRVQALWERMNKGIASKGVKPILNTHACSSNVKTSLQKPNNRNNWINYLGLAPKKRGHPKQDDQNNGSNGSQGVDNNFATNKTLAYHSGSSSDASSEKKSDNWMSYLGMAPKRAETSGQEASEKGSTLPNVASDEARKLAAAALSAVKDAAAAAAGRGKVEIREVRDFAGQEIEVKKLVDAESKEAAEKAKAPSTSAVDAILEQIKKKPKLSVLDKTKKDWGEYKDETKGLEEELDAYKKSSNQYLDRVSFLQRADYREFERERDARLAQQWRRRTDMQEDDL